MSQSKLIIPKQSTIALYIKTEEISCLPLITQQSRGLERNVKPWISLGTSNDDDPIILCARPETNIFELDVDYSVPLNHIDKNRVQAFTLSIGVTGDVCEAMANRKVLNVQPQWEIHIPFLEFCAIMQNGTPFEASCLSNNGTKIALHMVFTFKRHRRFFLDSKTAQILQQSPPYSEMQKKIISHAESRQEEILRDASGFGLDRSVANSFYFRVPCPHIGPVSQHNQTLHDFQTLNMNNIFESVNEELLVDYTQATVMNQKATEMRIEYWFPILVSCILQAGAHCFDELPSEENLRRCNYDELYERCFQTTSTFVGSHLAYVPDVRMQVVKINNGCKLDETGTGESQNMVGINSIVSIAARREYMQRAGLHSCLPRMFTDDPETDGDIFGGDCEDGAWKTISIMYAMTYLSENHSLLVQLLKTHVSSSMASERDFVDAFIRIVPKHSTLKCGACLGLAHGPKKDPTADSTFVQPLFSSVDEIMAWVQRQMGNQSSPNLVGHCFAALMRKESATVLRVQESTSPTQCICILNEPTFRASISGDDQKMIPQISQLIGAKPVLQSQASTMLSSIACEYLKKNVPDLKFKAAPLQISNQCDPAGFYHFVICCAERVFYSSPTPNSWVPMSSIPRWSEYSNMCLSKPADTEETKALEGAIACNMSMYPKKSSNYILPFTAYRIKRVDGLTDIQSPAPPISIIIMEDEHDSDKFIQQRERPENFARYVKKERQQTALEMKAVAFRILSLTRTIYYFDRVGLTKKKNV